MAKEKITTKNYTYAVGRRKEASARVRLFVGKAEHSVNEKPLKDYFPGDVNAYFFNLPFKVVDAVNKYYVTVRVLGGGPKGQLEAAQHGIARALSKLNVEYRAALKKAGLLTRDSRTRERRKIGTGGKARRQKQSPKR